MPTGRASRSGRLGDHAADRAQDVRIRAATTEVAAHPLAQLGIGDRDARHAHVRRRGAHASFPEFGHDRGRGTQLARRAEAALERVPYSTNAACSGDRRPFGRESFDGRDARAFVHHRERQARVDATAVDEDRAGAALAAVAALLRTGQADDLAQCVEQRDARLDLHRHVAAVDVQRDRASGRRRIADRLLRRRPFRVQAGGARDAGRGNCGLQKTAAGDGGSANARRHTGGLLAAGTAGRWDVVHAFLRNRTSR